MAKFEGIYPALITPFDRQDRVDAQAVGRVIARNLDQGVQGFYVGGSTGEALLMNLEERREMLELVLDQVAGRAQVLAHVGCFSTRDTIALAEHAVAHGVDAVSALPPFYYKYTLQELTDYYLEVVRAVACPMIVYNAPALTGVTFTSENLAPIFANPMVVGVKYTSYDLYQMQRLIAQNPEKVVINGHDEIFLAGLATGSRCAIGSTFNFMAHLFLGIRERFLAGDMEAANALQDKANDIIQVLLAVGVFRGVKGMLNVLGLECGECRKPFSPLTKEEYVQLEVAAKAL